MLFNLSFTEAGKLRPGQAKILVQGVKADELQQLGVQDRPAAEAYQFPGEQRCRGPDRGALGTWAQLSRHGASAEHCLG